MIKLLLKAFRREFIVVLLLSGVSYLLTLAMPFIMQRLFQSLESGTTWWPLFAAGAYFLLTPSYTKYAGSYKRNLGVDIRGYLDRLFYAKLQKMAKEDRKKKAIVSVPFFESYSAQYSVLVFFPDLVWLFAGIGGMAWVSVSYLGAFSTLVIALACAIYVLLSLQNIKSIGGIYYQILAIEKERIGMLSAVVKDFASFKYGRFYGTVTEALSRVRLKQKHKLTSRAWLQAWNETLIKGFFIVLFSVSVLALSYDDIRLQTVEILVLSLSLGVFLELLEDALSTIRVLYNVVIVDRKVQRLEIEPLPHNTPHQSPNELSLPKGIVGVRAKHPAVAMGALENAAIDSELVVGDRRYNLAGRVWYTSRSPFLFTGTIRDNIRLDQDVGEEQLDDTLAQFQLAMDIESFPNGLDKDVGANGGNLSTGQRVRVALARLATQNYDTIVVNDVFSCLDPAVGRAIQQGWRRHLKPHQTIIFYCPNIEHYGWADAIIDLDTQALERPQIEATTELSAQPLTKKSPLAPTDPKPSAAKDTDQVAAGQKPARSFGGFSALRRFLGPSAMGALIVLTATEVYSEINLAKVINGWKSGEAGGFNHELFYILGAIAVIALAAKNILVFFKGLAQSDAIHRSHVKSVLGLNTQQFATKDWGYYLNRLGNDFYTVEMSTPGFLAKLVFSVIASLAGTIFLSLLNPILGLLFLPLAIASFKVYRSLRKRLLRATDAFAAKRQPVIGFVVETDDHYLDVVASGLGAWAREHLNRLLSAREKAHKTFWQSTITMDFATALLLNSIVVIVLGVIAANTTSGSSGPYSLLALYFAISFRKDIGGLLSTIKSVETNLTALERLEEVSPAALKSDRSQGLNLEQREKPIVELKGVSCLRDRELVLTDFSAVFKSGEPTLITGRTGSGKSTLLGAIGGAVAIQTGSMTLASPVANPYIAYIGSHSFAWDITIENLLASEGFSVEKVGEFLADTTVAGGDTLKDWLNSMMAKNLKAIAHGDRQIIELIRQLANDPQVILLDEAFTSLPAQVERELVSRLVHHFPAKVILYVSHRPENVAHFFSQHVEITSANADLEGG